MKNTVRVERAIMDIIQLQLADAVGVSRNTIISIESGRYLPSAVLALKIARHFGKPVESIFQLDENDWELLYDSTEQALAILKDRRDLCYTGKLEFNWLAVPLSSLNH